MCLGQTILYVTISIIFINRDVKITEVSAVSSVGVSVGNAGTAWLLNSKFSLLVEHIICTI